MRLTLDAFPIPEDDRIEFGSPVQVQRVAYVDKTGKEQVIPSGEYVVDPLWHRHVAPNFGRFWPETFPMSGAVRIDYLESTK